MLRYGGVLLSPEQFGNLASASSGKDLHDMSDISKYLDAIFFVTWEMTGYFRGADLHLTFNPRDSTKDNDIWFLIVFSRYRLLGEALEKYRKSVPYEKDLPMLQWLERRGFDKQELLEQWTTVPDPDLDRRNAAEAGRREDLEKWNRRRIEQADKRKIEEAEKCKRDAQGAVEDA